MYNLKVVFCTADKCEKARNGEGLRAFAWRVGGNQKG